MDGIQPKEDQKNRMVTDLELIQEEFRDGFKYYSKIKVVQIAMPSNSIKRKINKEERFGHSRQQQQHRRTNSHILLQMVINKNYSHFNLNEKRTSSNVSSIGIIIAIVSSTKIIETVVYRY
ncbi:hypothetical protein ACTA71_010571 [Dictyostelium dimigraforme]